MSSLARWRRERSAAPPPPRTRARRLFTVLSVGALAAFGLAAPAPATAAPAPEVAAPVSEVAAPVSVIVSGPDVSAVICAVEAAGGRVTAELPLIDGVTAVLPGTAQLPPSFVVTPDRAVSFASTESSPAAPVSTVRATLGLPPNGNEGRGVTVAVVDTGVAEVPDLSGHIAAHVDVTGTGGGDGEGHGTFMAGLIAASGNASGGAYQGVAPGSRILDVKVARQDGGTSLGLVLKGLQAVADQGHRYGVEVLNLSLDSGSPVPYQVDPLNQALRALWRTGITVVVPSGNEGPAAGTIATPGNDPALLTIGGVDENGTAVHSDDTVAAWSGRGPTSQAVNKPDLAAPGAHVIGLRSPGSVVDREYPEARVGDDYFRGSGTSMSTAVASGAVADLLATNPRLKPDDVKALLRNTAYPAPGLADGPAAGAGGLDLATALVAAASHQEGKAAESDPAPGNPATWRKLAAAFEDDDPAAAQQAWDKLSPQARSWAARSWASLDPASQDWVARSWAARSWAGVGGVTEQEWAARSWAARSWAGDDWAARSWAARSWAGDDWAARSWAGDDWAARSWATDDWTARSWAATWR